MVLRNEIREWPSTDIDRSFTCSFQGCLDLTMPQDSLPILWSSTPDIANQSNWAMIASEVKGALSPFSKKGFLKNLDSVIRFFALLEGRSNPR